jgi:hypothetical protein
MGSDERLVSNEDAAEIRRRIDSVWEGPFPTNWESTVDELLRDREARIEQLAEKEKERKTFEAMWSGLLANMNIKNARIAVLRDALVCALNHDRRLCGHVPRTALDHTDEAAAVLLAALGNLEFISEQSDWNEDLAERAKEALEQYNKVLER